MCHREDRFGSNSGADCVVLAQGSRQIEHLGSARNEPQLEAAADQRLVDVSPRPAVQPNSKRLGPRAVRRRRLPDASPVCQVSRHPGPGVANTSQPHLTPASPRRLGAI